ncbi:hypothetical protein ACFYZJ_10105 [Streptomyces sp. NPDC001848]|uniref:hypothetical protein n=1 Tax=Streptomyces sp. NPDC001848 TaxID=3364618 RepID=UPI00367448A3
MSVSRTALRLIAACVASGALIGAAALPALADGGGHVRAQGRTHAHSDVLSTVAEDHDRGGQRHLDRNHGWYRDREHRHSHDHGRFGGRHGEPGRHHGWYGGRHHDRRFGDWLRDRSRHHGWYGERQRHHGHYSHRG